ncbi:hypothetical protein CspeluHIS016_0504620 [Cutaneotrichosporon spelunceum]|uniref:DNA-directed RNA polymerase III subunit RPC3 n=1 Tax=Cutaneotrichosporon spelunceum TaxID=1672016 RepID=A0AAD3YCS2_9TREE|nr:hypothetical protein CspeluHIS016_0504620 [Cutaneotrichosporon spelunceum]
MDGVNSNSKEAVRLCEHIVRVAFGDVVCRVASTLLNRGRSNAETIARLAALPRATTNASLLILIQHSLVGSTGGSRRSVPEEEQYEFDTAECLLRLRWGRILALTESNFGEDTLMVVHQLLVYGKMTFAQIVNACGADTDKKRASALRKIVVQLLRRGYLEPSCAELLILRSDQIDRRYRAKWLDKSAATGTKLHTASVLAEMRQKAASEIDDERKEYRNPSKALKEVKGKKRERERNQPEDDMWDVVDDVPLRVNYDKYNVLIRNEMLIKAASDRWNEGAGEVLRAALAASLDEQYLTKEIRTEKAVGVNNIVSNIPTSKHKLLMAGMAGSGSKNIPDIVRLYLGVMSGDDLASDNTSTRYFSHSDHTNPSYWIEIEAICTSLKASLLTELVRERIDDTAARVLAVVARAHYASETMVRDCAMIPLREARHILSELQKLSLIDIQEVPKTAAKGRSQFPGADFHLWGIDLRKAYGFLLSGVYKTSANIVQRRQKEWEKRAALLAKLDRPDVRGMDPNLYLSAKDQADYVDLQNALTMLSLAEARTDLVVMMLRDLPGGIPTR